MKDITELSNWELNYVLLMKKLKVENIDYLYNVKEIKEEIKRRGIRNISKYNYELLLELLSKMKKRFFEKEMVLGIFELDNRDEFFYNNLVEMNQMMDEYYHVLSPSIEAKDKIRMDRKEIISLIRNILGEIDNTGEWEYEGYKLLTSDKFVCLKEITEKEKQEIIKKLCLSKLDCSGLVYNNDTGEVYNLFFNNEYVIDAVPELIHEIVHYVSVINGNKNPQRVLKEFPSIFYEKYAISLLDKMGYGNIDYLDSVRNNDLISSYNDIYNIMYYLELYKEDKLTSDRMLKNNLETINTMIEHPYIFNYVYPYIIGSTLADKANMMVLDDELVLPIIKYITENLERINPEDVINIFNYRSGYTKKKK